MRPGIVRDFSPYQRKREVLKRYQETKDIVSGLMQYHPVDATDYDKVSEMFWTGDVKSTCQKLFDFAKRYVRYKIEPDRLQSIRSPAAIFSMPGGDCKHYASFIVGVLDSLRRKGYPVKTAYRFASYKPFDRNVHHVFAVAKDAEGVEYWIDPVLKSFDRRKMYWYSFDKMPGMSLVRISGVGDDDSIDGIGRKSKAERKAGRTQRREKRQAKHPKRAKLFKKLKKINPAMVAARNSFLALLKLNVFHIASKIKSQLNTDANKNAQLKKLWEDRLGGNYNKLTTAISQGVKVWNKHHPSKKISGDTVGIEGIGYIDGLEWQMDSVHGIGVVQFAGAAAMVAAAYPIIKMIKSLFKPDTFNEEKVDEMAEQGGQDLSEQADMAEGGYSEGGDQVEGEKGTGIKARVSKTRHADGSETLNIKSTNFDLENQRDEGEGGGGGNLPARTNSDSKGISEYFSTAKEWVIDHKKEVAIGAGVLGTLWLLPKLIPRRTGRRR